MQTSPLLTLENPVECTILKRRNRFVVEVERHGHRYTASTNNTGRLLDYLTPGRKAFCLPHFGRTKTDYSLFAIEDSSAAALIDTQLQMRAFENAWNLGLIPWLSGLRIVRRNPRLRESVFDYLAEGEGEPAYLEVKSAVSREGVYAMYPDCPTVRGRRHVRALTDYALGGGKAIILFIAALPWVTLFRPDRRGDPELCDLLGIARDRGVLLKAVNILYRPDDRAVCLVDSDLPVELSPGPE